MLLYKKHFWTVFFLIFIPLELLADQLYKPKENSVNTFDLFNHWDFSGDYISLQPNDRSDTGYEYEPGFQPGFRLSVAKNLFDYRAIFINWLHYAYNSIGTTHAQDDFGLGEGPTDIRYEYSNELNVVNLGFENTFNFKDKIELGFLGGLQYFSARSIVAYELESNITQSSGFESTDSSLKGLGAMVGLHFAYYFWQHLSFEVEATYSTVFIYAGHNTEIVNLIDRQTVPAITVFTTQESRVESVIGGQDADISINYTEKLNRGSLSLKAGWIGIAFGTFDTRWEGGYLGAKWIG